MKKKIIIFILAAVILGIVIFWRTIFICNGNIFENIVYKSQHLIIRQEQVGNRNLIILGTGYSLSVDEQDKIVNHDPLMVLPNIEFQEETVMSIFYPFESKGLEIAGKELSIFVNSNIQNYDSITLIGHSKCGVCFANAAKWFEHENVNIVTISTPFQGTPVADRKAMLKKLDWFSRLIYEVVFSNHAVDKDIMPSSDFMKNVDYSGLEKYVHINIISKNASKSQNLLDVVLAYFDKRAEVNGDGIVPQASQQYVSYANSIEDVIEASHATSFNIGVEKVKELLGFSK